MLLTLSASSYFYYKNSLRYLRILRIQLSILLALYSSPRILLDRCRVGG